MWSNHPCWIQFVCEIGAWVGVYVYIYIHTHTLLLETFTSTGPLPLVQIAFGSLPSGTARARAETIEKVSIHGLSVSQSSSLGNQAKGKRSLKLSGDLQNGALSVRRRFSVHFCIRQFCPPSVVAVANVTRYASRFWCKHEVYHWKRETYGTWLHVLVHTCETESGPERNSTLN